MVKGLRYEKSTIPVGEEQLNFSADLVRAFMRRCLPKAEFLRRNGRDQPALYSVRYQHEMTHPL